MVNAILSVLILSVAIFVIAQVLPGIKLKGFVTAIMVAVVYSVIDFLCSGIIRFLSLPLVWLTLGLFIFVINAFLLWVTDLLIEDFEIKGVGNLLLAAVLITICNVILGWIF